MSISQTEVKLNLEELLREIGPPQPLTNLLDALEEMALQTISMIEIDREAGLIISAIPGCSPQPVYRQLARWEAIHKAVGEARNAVGRAEIR